MALIVQKYGGTSVGSPERIWRVAERVAARRRAGADLIVVVSAMGDATDDLIELARSVVADPRRDHPRELDMLLTAGERISMALLAMAIREAGVEAISFTGSQAAIITDGAHTGARIEEVRGGRIPEEVDRGRVVIVAGFQGVSRSREITTLGRGGSDTTAVALAAAFGAEACEIYTDVDGVYTADPRIVPGARRLARVDYDDMIELAGSGARVLHARAVEMAARFGVPVRVLSSFEPDVDGGTLIERRRSEMEELLLTGMAAESGHARLVLRGVPAGMATTAAVLSRLADAGVSLDMVSHADRADGRRQIQVTVREEELAEATAVCRDLVAELGGEALDVQPNLSRVAIVGSGMHGRPGVFARAFDALLRAGIEVHAIATSAVSIAVLVPAEHEVEAQRALYDAFEWTGGEPS